MNRRSIIVLEANEVPFRIFDYFVSRHPRSALAQMMDRGSQYVTHTEDKAKFIMPWTTWPSMHRGVNDEHHNIFKFGQWEIETDRKYPPLWSLLARSGIRTGVFSSMQSAPLPTNAQDYAFYFPDMFSTDSATQPPDLETLQKFSLAMTRENARNVSRHINLGAAWPVLRDARRLGLRAGTFADIGRQLASEVLDPTKKTRRRAYQPLMLLDVFLNQVRQKRPQFSTFFTNHVAAAMHRYWAAAFPGDYDQFNLDSAWVDRYSSEIEFAMTKLDSIVQRLKDFVDQNPDYMLALATSMGQAAIPASHVKEFLTITDVPKLLEKVGLRTNEYEERPAMVPDFSFHVTSRRADEVESALQQLSIDGEPAEYHRENDFFHVSVYREKPGIRYVTFRGQEVAIQELGLGYMVHEDEVSCTAQHVPEGSLIVYSPHGEAKPAGKRRDISALEYAPAVMGHFGLEAPGYMRRTGFQLDS